MQDPRHNESDPGEPGIDPSSDSPQKPDAGSSQPQTDDRQSSSAGDAAQDPVERQNPQDQPGPEMDGDPKGLDLNEAGIELGAGSEPGEAGGTGAADTDLAKAQERIKELEGSLLRSQADIENIKRRNSADVANAHKYAIERFSLEVLLLRDHLEMGAASIDNIDPDGEKAFETVRRGFEMVLESFPGMLQRFGISEIECLSKPFDPNLHEAVGTEPSEELEANHVVAVRQKGYTISDRLLRPALVVVAK